MLTDDWDCHQHARNLDRNGEFSSEIFEILTVILEISTDMFDFDQTV